MSGPYDDIIELPHPTSTKHSRMPISDRASIFSPFAALTGHGDAIQETARLTETRIELDEDTKATTGQLKKVDDIERTLRLVDGTTIPLDDVLELRSDCFHGIFQDG